MSFHLIVSRVGYKLRVHIAKHLQSRSETIRTAINAYNTTAKSLKPARATLDYKKVIKLTFLNEFDILRGSRTDVLGKPWANPANRLRLDQYYRVLHAKEEIRRLNVEIRRLHTWIRDEAVEYQIAIERTKVSGDIPLSLELLRCSLSQLRVNSRISISLQMTENLDGFNGVRGPGLCLGTDAPPTPCLKQTESRSEGADNTTEESGDLELDAEAMAEERLDRLDAALIAMDGL